MAGLKLRNAVGVERAVMVRDVKKIKGDKLVLDTLGIEMDGRKSNVYLSLHLVTNQNCNKRVQIWGKVKFSFEYIEFKVCK